jgi:hypothetical protein
MRFLGFSNHEKGALRQEISKWLTVYSTFSRSGWSVVRNASLAKGGTSKNRPSPHQHKVPTRSNKASPRTLLTALIYEEQRSVCLLCELEILQAPCSNASLHKYSQYHAQLIALLLQTYWLYEKTASKYTTANTGHITEPLMLYIYIRDALGSNLSRITRYLHWSFPQSVQVNARIISPSGHDHFLPNSYSSFANHVRIPSHVI